MASYGPLARTMDDIELAYDIVCAPDPRHGMNLPMTSPVPLHDSVSKYKITWVDEMGGFHASNDTKSILENFIYAVDKAGVDTSQITFSQAWFDKIVEIWGVYFGLLNGAELPWVVRQVMKLRFGKMDKGAKLRIAHHIQEGFNINFKTYSRTTRLRQQAEAELYDYFTDYDFIVSPVMMGPPSIIIISMAPSLSMVKKCTTSITICLSLCHGIV